MFRAGTAKRQGSQPQILVVRLGSLGDVVHALPAVATLKHGFPGSVLTWVVNPRWSPLLEGNPFVDRLIFFDRRNLSCAREAWSLLRANRYDFAVDLQGLVQSALIASFARADRIYGFHESQAREKLAAVFYSNRVRATSSHVVDKNLELVAAAGASTMLPTFPLPEGTPEGDLPAGPFVLANPAAGWGAKQWPVDYYRAIAERLRSELGLTLVVNGPPGAGPALSEVSDAVVNISGIAGLIYATRRAAAVLGTDSGPMHLAAALGRPGVAIFGPTAPERNGPYGNSFVVLRSPGAATSYKRQREPARSMREVTPDAVFDALKKRLATSGRTAECSSL